MTARTISPLETSSAGSKGRILIVDNDPETARAIASVAVSSGFQVIGLCDDIRKGLQAAEDMRPNLVISGLFFHGEPLGIELSRAIQETLGAPVIFVGQSEDPLLMLQVAMAQPAGYISDARDASYVEAVLNRALRGVRTTVGSPF
jgi:DNA-binding NarL/FixJ family response regulator